MALITPWTTLAPAQQDVPGVQQPDLVDDSLPGAFDGDLVLASQVMALRDKLQAAYQEIGTNPGDLPVPTSLRARVAALESLAPVANTIQTLDALPTTIITLSLTDPSVRWVEVSVVGRQVPGGNRFAARLMACVYCEGGGAVIGNQFLQYQFASNPAWAISLAVSGNDVLPQVQGAGGTTINWAATVRSQPAT